MSPLSIRKGLRPGFRIGVDLHDDQDKYRRVWPFRRSWVAIAILTVMDIIFLIPAISTLKQVIVEWGKFDSLFDLVGALFLSAWLLGWSIGPLIMTGILVLMLFGREVLTVRPETAELFLGVPFAGLVTSYDVSKMRNIRTEQPPKKSGKSWRGTHFAFEGRTQTICYAFFSENRPVTYLCKTLDISV